MVLAVVFIMLLSGFFGRSLMYVMAEEEADTRPEKYYTSIHLKDGDTLWSIAQTYCADSEESVEEYVRELRQMNSLSDDHIDAGHYIHVHTTDNRDRIKFIEFSIFLSVVCSFNLFSGRIKFSKQSISD